MSIIHFQDWSLRCPEVNVAGFWLWLSYKAIRAPYHRNVVCLPPSRTAHLYILCQQEKARIGHLHLIKQAAMCAEKAPLRVGNLI